MSTEHQEAVQELDVRELTGEPFEQIVSALDTVSETRCSGLVNSFEPVPLYDVLTSGDSRTTRSRRDEEWHVTITHAVRWDRARLVVVHHRQRAVGLLRDNAVEQLRLGGGKVFRERRDGDVQFVSHVAGVGPFRIFEVPHFDGGSSTSAAGR